jgi:UDP-glucose 4-epimerase
LESSSNENPLRTLRVNCEGTLNIFESALKAGVKKVVWASSIAVFGFDRHSVPGPIANDAYHQPGNLYGACKSLNEQFSKFYNQQGDINCVGLRYSAIYGYGKALTVARGTGADFLEQLIDKPALGEKGIVPYGDVVLDWLYVEDASRATIAAANTESYASSGFNICGSRHSMGEVAAEVRKIIPDAVIDVQPGTPFDGVFDTCFDMSTTADAINYMPQISLQEGLQKNISMLRNT